ncbi:MAG: CPBP family intramembrane glutamic endopeptidase [Pseudomonadota bacterium]
MSHPGEEMAEMPTWKLLGLTCLQTVVFIAVGLGLWVLSGRLVSSFVTIDLAQIGLGLTIAGAMIALGYALFRGLPTFGEKLVRDQAKQFAFLDRRLGLGAITLLAACAGIGEEALFRGGVLILASEYMPFAVALIFSSAIFAAIHFAKPVITTLIFTIGAVFGLIYWYSGSLLAVMIGHWVYDIWALWFIQEEMHRLGVFDDAADTPEINSDNAAETLP